jgi:transposase-like protein
MFEDLVKQKEVSIEKQIERCPYCGSYLIQKSNRQFTIDDRWTQRVTCRLCNSEWTIIYNEDQSPRQIDIDKKGD